MAFDVKHHRLFLGKFVREHPLAKPRQGVSIMRDVQREIVAKFVVENDDSRIPESFKQGMDDAAAGRFVDMETVLSGAKPPSRAAE